MAEQKGIECAVPLSGEGASSENVIKKSKSENEAAIDSDKSPHHHEEETHGKSDDIDENAAVDEVKGPSVFQRAKEEVEAIVGSVLPKK